MNGLEKLIEKFMKQNGWTRAKASAHANRIKNMGLEIIEDELAEKESTIKSVRGVVSTVTLELNEKDRIINKLNGEALELENAIKRLEQLVELNKNKVDELEKNVKSLELERDVLNETVLEMKCELDAKRESTEEEIKVESLSDKINVLEEEIKGAEYRLATLENLEEATLRSLHNIGDEIDKLGKKTVKELFDEVEIALDSLKEGINEG